MSNLEQLKQIVDQASEAGIVADPKEAQKLISELRVI